MSRLFMISDSVSTCIANGLEFDVSKALLRVAPVACLQATGVA